MKGIGRKVGFRLLLVVTLIDTVQANSYVNALRMMGYDTSDWFTLSIDASREQAMY